jgi:hypothetical protein
MQTIKGMNGRLFRSAGLFETPTPPAYDSTAMPGSVILGLDKRIYISSSTDPTAPYSWQKVLFQTSDGTVLINTSANFSGGFLGLVVAGFGGSSELMPGRIAIVPGVEPGQFASGGSKIIGRLEFMSRDQLSVASNLGRPARISVYAPVPGWTSVARPCDMSFQVGAPDTTSNAAVPPLRVQILSTGDLYVNGMAAQRLVTVTPDGNVLIGNTTGTEKLAVTGNVQLTSTANTYKVGTNSVVGARRTGWVAPTGTATRTAFDTTSATTAQLAERLKALIDDLSAHGLIGA